MLRVTYSSSLDALVEALAAGIAGERAEKKESPLVPVPVIVPNRATAAFAKMAIARRSGIAANLRFEFLERFLAERAAKPVAGADALRALILGVLLDPEAMEDPELEPVREYIAAGGIDRETLDRRRFQLADQLARLFREYRNTRRAMLEAWRERTMMADSTRAETERWQRALWKRLSPRLGPNGDLALLPDAIERAELAPGSLPAHVHVFGFSLLSPSHVEMLVRLGRKTSVRLYALNPSRAFWQERESGGSALLEMWGRPGREHVALLNEAIDYVYEERFVEVTPEKTALDVIANDVLDGRDEAARSSVSGGVSLFACPGVRREIETIASEIWSLVRVEGSTMRFSDIALAIAGREGDGYRTHVSAVFAETYDIPHHFLDVPIRATSRIVEAIELLLALPTSRYSRQDLLRLLLHPAIAANKTDVDTAEWARWLDALAVVHGADKSDHQGTYIEKDLYNWDQGMRRLVLGTLMSGERSGDDRPFELGGEKYLPLECAPDRLASISRLVVLVRSLIADARFLRESELGLGKWAELLHVYVTTYLGAETDADARDLEACLGAIRELAESDLISRPVSFSIAASTVIEGIGSLQVNRGQALADGVAVAPLSSIAALPFRAVFVAGLGESQFPASEVKSQLDLRAEARRRGDVSPRDEDEWSFLQRVLATRERLCLSWVSREARTGDPLEPSSTVLELSRHLERRFGAVERVEVPLRRWDPRCFSALGVASLPARRERAIFELREHLAAALPGGGFPDLPQLYRELPKAIFDPLSARLGLAPLPPPREPEARAETIEVPLWVVRQFLEDPREAWTKLALRLREERIDDPLAREDEAFATPAIEAANLLRDVFLERLRAGELADEERFFRDAYAARAETLELRGVLPTGVFAVAEREKHVQLLATWAGLLRSMHAGALELVEPLRFGRARESARVSELLDPIAFELARPRAIRAEITGQTSAELVPATSLVLVLGAEAPRRELLRAFVEHAAAAALDRGADRERRVLILSGAGKKRAARLAPFSKSEARNYLHTLLEDLFAAPHTYHLPWERALGEDPKTEPRGRRSQLPPAPPPSPEEQAAIVARRFAPFLAKVTEEA
jgi:exodeoxyribonuclease V gamma subunit